MAREAKHIRSCLRGVISRQCEAMGASKEKTAQILDPNREPDPVPCPYCGRSLHYRLLVPEEPSWGWCPIPEPCPNPECIAKAEAEHVREQRRRQFAKLFRDMREAGIPRAYQHATTGTFETCNTVLRKALDTVKDWVLDFDSSLETGHGLYICGPERCGKTHLAVIAARGALSQNRYVRFVSAADLVNRLRAGNSHDQLTEYRNCTLLVLDDLGAQGDQRWILTRLYELISARCAEGRPTVYTTRDTFSGLEMNLAQSGASEIATATVSLIAEMSQVVRVVSGRESCHG